MAENAPQTDATDAPEATNDPQAASSGQINILLDMQMPVTVRLGKTNMKVRDLMQLGEGTVLKLDRLAGEPVDLMLRGVRFAVGDLVVVGQKLGVRVRQILDDASDAISGAGGA